MRTRWMWVLGLSVATLSGLQACGSDGGGRIRDKDDGSAGDDGTGARSSGGRSGSGGAPGSSGGAGGANGACNIAACDQQIAPIQGLIGMFGGGAISIKSCCVNATTCGIDLGALSMLLGAAGGGCIDPSTLIMPPPTVVDSGAPPVGIQLDKSCPDIANAAFDLPGCCRPNGLCGGSTHTVQGAGTTVPIACVSYDAAAMSAASAGLGVVVPEDPNIHCNYTIGPPDVPEAGAPDASPPAPVPDASPPGRPDAGAPPDAAAKDASAKDAAPTAPAAKDAAAD